MQTIKETAIIFKVSTRTVYHWMEEGVINFIKIGGTVRILDEEIERLKKGNENDTRENVRTL